MVPLPPLPSHLRERLKDITDQFFFKLKSVIWLSGGSITNEDALRNMPLEDAVEMFYTNSIEFDIVPTRRGVPRGCAMAFFSFETTDGKKFVQAPIQPDSTGGIFGVYLAPDEEVEWTYQDQRIVGYIIKKRPSSSGGLST